LDIAHGIRERDIDDRRERPGIEAHGVFNVLPHCRDVSTYGQIASSVPKIIPTSSVFSTRRRCDIDHRSRDHWQLSDDIEWGIFPDIARGIRGH